MDYTIRIVVIIALVNSLWCACVSNAFNPRGNSCPDPGTPDNGRRGEKITVFHTGQTVSYFCHSTYQLVGPQIRLCQANGSWTGYKPSCEKYMCDNLDALPPMHGKRIGKNFTIGNKLEFKCYSHYKLIGENVITCLPDGKWSARPPKCEHLCDPNQMSCDEGMICKMRNLRPTCVCRSNMECSSRWDPVCGNDGISYNNKCIMNATACRLRKDIRIVHDDRCLPGDRCSIFPTSNCRAAFNVFFYNVTARSCQRVIVGGCHPSGWNGFFYKNDCKNFCERDVCALNPEKGACNSMTTRWYYDLRLKKCKTFKYGGCFGNPNNFRTMDDCMMRCGV
ncbi:four-domain proteases inhibitor-like [Dendronephthya gigantea]|uniref:four-domain proteases inhibitor-like n=1 Tax=Dendronephthya gigantea TaxID=151771 RepID=UPI00106D362C|nr:four-domain proteases inhibitor-like [Dendronephthya gigantea]